MQVIIKSRLFSPCQVSVFSINDEEAWLSDFGKVKKVVFIGSVCELSGFDAAPPASAVLHKYSISIEEYKQIIEQLNSAFDFGICGCCS